MAFRSPCHSPIILSTFLRSIVGFEISPLQASQRKLPLSSRRIFSAQIDVRQPASHEAPPKVTSRPNPQRQTSARSQSRRRSDPPRQTSESSAQRSQRIPVSDKVSGDLAAIDRRSKSWRVQKETLQTKFKETGWSPRKRLSPDALDGIRALNAQYPDRFTTPVLAEQFKISPEAIRRILKSKWRPREEEALDRRERWARRFDRIWDHQAELGLRPERTSSRPVQEPGEEEDVAEGLLKSRP